VDGLKGHRKVHVYVAQASKEEQERLRVLAKAGLAELWSRDSYTSDRFE
jgi:hypothetical protein